MMANFLKLRGGFFRPHSLFFLVVMCSGFSFAFADENSEREAKVLLGSARQAAANLNYQGTISYMRDSQIENLHVFHGVNNGLEQERMLSLNTPMREVVRTADKVTCYYPETKSVSIDVKPSRHSVLINLPSDLTTLSKHYNITLGAVEHVLKRPAQVILIEPKDDLRYGRRLWIDAETKLPLKSEWTDEHGNTVEAMAFSSINFVATIAQSELNPSTQIDATWKTKQHETLPAQSLIWALDGVPDGFQLTSYTRLKRNSSNRTIDHILLSDGVSSISVYIDELMGEIFTGQPRKVGAINSYTRKMDKYLITAMGEVPEKALLSIANGIHLQGNNQ